MRSVCLTVLTLLLATVAFACGTPGSGTDVPESGALPPPPQQLPLDTVEPCRLLTADQLRTLDVGGEISHQADSRRGAGCQWSHFPGEPQEGYLVELHVERDVEGFLTLPAQTLPTAVAGFPAVQTDFVGLGMPRPGSCTVLVGVAEGQTMQITYSYTGSLRVTTEQSCTKAQTAAEMAVQTVIERHGADR